MGNQSTQETSRMSGSNIYVSFGENCLTDNILERYNLKSFSSPYSSSRSNIEYIVQIENEEFSNLLSPQYLYHDISWGAKVSRNQKYNCTNSYETSCMRDFEFTHHDVIENLTLRDTMQRRCQRMLSLSCDNLFIFYHHRICPNTDFHKLISDLLKLKHIYQKRCKNVTVIMFTQNIVLSNAERKVEHQLINGINVYTFYTLNRWGGNDTNIFYARCDDDLISVMINDVKTKY